MKYFVLLTYLFIFFSCSKTPSEVPLDSYREVEFNVDLNKIIDEGLFEVNADTLKLILDSFDVIEMIDGNDDNIYSVIISNMIISKTYEYQYAINDSAEELEVMRILTVQDNENNVLDYYEELNPTILIFHVDMSFQIESETFNPDTDFLDVAGTFNLWDGTNSHLVESDNEIYEISITNVEADEEITFKFRINGNWDTAEFPDNGPNRSYTVKQGEIIEDYCYNDECGI